MSPTVEHLLHEKRLFFPPENLSPHPHIPDLKTYDQMYKSSIEEEEKHVREQIGPIAIPDTIHFLPSLPKTRSGKIVRRVLRSIVNNQLDQIGDITTLADPDIIPQIIKTIR